MMLLLDFAVVVENRSGGKKTHGNHSNNTDREYLSVSNNQTATVTSDCKGIDLDRDQLDRQLERPQDGQTYRALPDLSFKLSHDQF